MYVGINSMTYFKTSTYLLLTYLSHHEDLAAHTQIRTGFVLAKQLLNLWGLLETAVPQG